MAKTRRHARRRGGMFKSLKSVFSKKNSPATGTNFYVGSVTGSVAAGDKASELIAKLDTMKSDGKMTSVQGVAFESFKSFYTMYLKKWRVLELLIQSYIPKVAADMIGSQEVEVYNVAYKEYSSVADEMLGALKNLTVVPEGWDLYLFLGMQVKDTKRSIAGGNVTKAVKKVGEDMTKRLAEIEHQEFMGSVQKRLEELRKPITPRRGGSRSRRSKKTRRSRRH